MKPRAKKTTEPTPLDESLGKLLLRAQRLYVERAALRMQERGCEQLGMAVSSLLRCMTPEGTRASLLAEQAGMTKQAAGQTLADLETRGFVTRRPDANDRRASLVCLTDAGRRYLVELYEVKAEVERELADCVGKTGVKDLRRLLGELVSKLPTGEC